MCCELTIDKTLLSNTRRKSTAEPGGGGGGGAASWTGAKFSGGATHKHTNEKPNEDITPHNCRKGALKRINQHSPSGTDGGVGSGWECNGGTNGGGGRGNPER